MSIAENPDASDRLIRRVRDILIRPAATWDVIESEPATIRGLYMGYVAPLAAIGPVCTAIGQIAFGATGSLGLTYHPPILRTVGGALIGWIMALVGIYLFALIIEFIARQFGAPKDRVRAFKLAAYGCTAAWVAAIFNAFPPISLLSIVGLYSLYLFYLGLPKLMKVTGDKALIYTVVVIVAGVGVGFLISILTAELLGPLLMLGGMPG